MNQTTNQNPVTPTSTSTIQWVVFDIGGVIINIDIWAAAKKMAKITGMSQETINQHFTDRYDCSISNLNLAERYQLGLMESETFLDEIENLASLSVDKNTIRDIWNSVIISENPKTLDIIQQLKGSCSLGIFSNTNDLHWQHMKANYKFHQHFDKIFLSHEIKLSKPHPDVFTLMQHRLDIPAENCLFIDDIEKNIEVATAAGWHAVHFQSAEQLTEELQNMQLLVPVS